jgi:chemotaxis protein MotB
MASDRDINTGGVEVDPNAWMATFADLLMLLLTFFVMLLTMKSMDSGKAREIFVRTYGPLDFISQDDYVPPLDEFNNYVKTSVITSTEALEKAIDLLEGVNPIPGRERPIANLRDIIEVSESEQGVVITLESDRLFDSGDAEIHPDRLAVLDTIAQLFQYAANDILIMGHTDSTPIRDKRFGSNWELSVYRALNVLYYMSDAAGMNPERLAAGGFGDRMPRFPNDSDLNRSKNRRVEFILKQTT